MVAAVQADAVHTAAEAEDASNPSFTAAVLAAADLTRTTDVVAAAISLQIATCPCAKSVKSEATRLAYVGIATTSNLLLLQTAGLVRCMHLQATLQVIGIWILVQILT